MTTLEDLNNPSITEVSRDEAIEMLRNIRLSRRTPVKKATTTKKAKAKAVPEVTSDQAAELLKLLGS